MPEKLDQFEQFEQEVKHNREEELKALSPVELIKLKEDLLHEYSNLEHDIHYVNALLKRQNYEAKDFRGGAF